MSQVIGGDLSLNGGSDARVPLLKSERESLLTTITRYIRGGNDNLQDILVTRSRNLSATLPSVVNTARRVYLRKGSGVINAAELDVFPVWAKGLGEEGYSTATLLVGRKDLDSFEIIPLEDSKLFSPRDISAVTEIISEDEFYFPAVYRAEV